MNTLSTKTKTTFDLLIVRQEDGLVLSRENYDTEDISEVRVIAKEMKGMLSYYGDAPIKAQIVRKDVVTTFTVAEEID